MRIKPHGSLSVFSFFRQSFFFFFSAIIYFLLVAYCLFVVFPFFNFCYFWYYSVKQLARRQEYDTPQTLSTSLVRNQANTYKLNVYCISWIFRYNTHLVLWLVTFWFSHGPEIYIKTISFFFLTQPWFLLVSFFLLKRFLLVSKRKSWFNCLSSLSTFS